MWKAASILIGLVLVLVALGLVMLASTSGTRAYSEWGSAAFFVRQQMVWIGFALVAGTVCARLDYHVWRRWAVPLALFTLVLLLMVLIPGVGLRVKGSRRWLSMGFFRIQPSEIAKFAVVVLMAWWMHRIRRKSYAWIPGLVVPGTLLGLFVGLVLVSPDYGTAALLAVVGAVVMFLGGTRPAHLLLCGAAGAGGLALAVLHNPIRMDRILAFQDPFEHAMGAGYQLIHAWYAFVVGGPTGVGLGQSLQKHYYLPEAHTDFIFAIIGEELGMAGTLSLLLLYVGVALCGAWIAFRAPDSFGRMLGFGFTFALTLQTAMNIAVVTGCIPTTGLALPFVSYGGSNLIMSAAMIGVLVNIARHTDGRVRDGDTRAIKDRFRAA